MKQEKWERWGHSTAKEGENVWKGSDPLPKGPCFHGHFSQHSSWPRGFGAPVCSLSAPAVLQEREGAGAVVISGAEDLFIQNHKEWTNSWEVYKPFSHALSPTEGLT